MFRSLFSKSFNIKPSCSHTCTRKASSQNVYHSGPNLHFLWVIPGGLIASSYWKYLDFVKKEATKMEAYSKMNIPAIPLPQRLEEVNDLEYRQIKLKGTFSKDKQIFLGPLKRVIPVKFDGEGNVTEPEVTLDSGYNIVLPFTLTNSDLKVLVNLGWVPRDINAKRQNVLKHQLDEISEEEEVELIGIVQKTVVKYKYIFDKGHAENNFYYRDIERLAKFAGTLSLYFDALETTSKKNGPEGTQTVYPSTLLDQGLTYTLMGLGFASSILIGGLILG